MSKYYANQMMHGDRAITVNARMAITQGGGAQLEGCVKIMAGFAGFTQPQERPISPSEFEVWDCEIIIIPKRIYSKGPFAGHRLGQVITELGGDIQERFKKCETIE